MLPLTLLIYSLSSFKTYDHILRPHWYLRSIPSPPGVSFIEGNTRAILESDPGTVHRQWHKAYGHTFRYDGLLSVCCLPFAPGPALWLILFRTFWLVGSSALYYRQKRLAIRTCIRAL